MVATLLSIVLWAQVVATPIANGQLIVSNGAPQFPDLPAGVEATGLDENWELLYYTVIPSGLGHIVRGELRNTSSNPLEAPTFLMTLPGGMQIDAVADISYVAPGDRAPFSALLYEDEAVIALNQSQEIQFGICESYGVVPKQELNWEFQDVVVEWNPEGTDIQVSGTVVNLGPTVERHAPTLFGFSEDGHYAGTIDDISDSPETLFTGDTFQFEMNQGITTFHSDDPFVGGGRELTFVLAMANPIGAYLSCV